MRFLYLILTINLVESHKKIPWHSWMLEYLEISSSRLVSGAWSQSLIESYWIVKLCRLRSFMSWTKNWRKHAKKWEQSFTSIKGRERSMLCRMRTIHLEWLTVATRLMAGTFISLILQPHVRYRSFYQTLLNCIPDTLKISLCNLIQIQGLESVLCT